jgi:hypothetical protein
VALSGDANTCVDAWDDHGTALNSTGNCDEFDFTLKYNAAKNPPYDDVTVTVTASNPCGQTTKNFTFIPTTFSCEVGGENSYQLAIYPNPASDAATVQIFSLATESKEPIDIKEIEIMDFTGTVVRNVRVEANQATLDLSGLNNGRYYVRTSIEGINVIEKLNIQRE